MSPLAKVFVVLNLMVALGFLGVSATLFTSRQKWVDEYAALKGDLDSLEEKQSAVVRNQRKEIDRYKENNSALDSTIQNLTTIKDQLTSDLGEKSKTIAQQNTEIEKLRDDLSIREQRLGERDTEIARLTAQKDELIEANDQAKKDRRMAIAELNRARVDKERVAQELTDMTQEYVGLQKVHAEDRSTLDALIARGVPISDIVVEKPAPAVDAAVVAVRPESNLVILSVGYDDKVRIGHEFTIYRGDQFVAKVRVIKVTPDLAGARIIYLEDDNTAIRTGDKASTRIGAS